MSPNPPRCPRTPLDVLAPSALVLSNPTFFTLATPLAIGIIKVVATVHNGVIPVRMFNPHSKPQRIYKGSTIGQLYPLSGTTEKNEQEQPCYYVCQSLSPQENNEDTVSKDACSKSLKELENIFKIDNVKSLQPRKIKCTTYWPGTPK